MESDIIKKVSITGSTRVGKLILKKAGFQMLPVIENESNRTNRQILWHAFLLIPWLFDFCYS